MLAKTTIALVTISAALLAGVVDAAALRFRIDPTNPKAYHYVSGDLPFEVAASMQGKVELSTDSETQAARLKLVDVTLHNPHGMRFGVPHEYNGHFAQEIVNLDGAALASTTPEVSDILTGSKTAPGLFWFTTQSDNRVTHVLELSLARTEAGYKLSGVRRFNGMDGGTTFFDMSLIQVPEPTTLVLAATMLVGCALLRRK